MARSRQAIVAARAASAAATASSAHPSGCGSLSSELTWPDAWMVATSGWGWCLTNPQRPVYQTGPPLPNQGMLQSRC